MIMACFIVPATEAVITTIATKVIKSKEEEKAKNLSSEETYDEISKIKFSSKLGWLNKLLWGGSTLLAFEHLWHGEITTTFPFLTAVENGETANMVAEMSSNGVMMSVLVTTIWVGMVVVSSMIEKKAIQSNKPKHEGV